MKKFDFVKKIPAPPRDGAGIVPPVMTPLPLGSVMPEGWLKGQFRLSADGFFSHMDDISYFMSDNNGWLKWQKTADEYRKEWKPVPYWNGGYMEEYHYARSAWEEQAYWLRGAYRLAVITGNPRLTRICEDYFEAMLASRRPDGYFGPEVLREIDSDVGKIPDIWPHFVMADVLADRYDVTGDRRVLDLLNGFFRYCDGLPEEKLIPPRSEYWQWQGAIQMDRCCDALPVIHRVYRVTGDRALLSLSEKLYKKWREDKSVRVNRHVVNFAERFRYAAQRYPLTGDRSAINESKRMLRRHMLKWGQMPGGLWAADENTRRGKHDPRQGTETCAMSEAVKSFTYMATLTGESGWADRSEDLMFNSYPASHTPDYKGLHYLTADNQPELDGKDHDYDNKGMMTRYSAFAYRCCQHNTGMAWPNFITSSFHNTEDGLVSMSLMPCTASTEVGGKRVTVTVDTEYPFDLAVTYRIKAPDGPVPLYIRIPSWDDGGTVKAGGETVSLDGRNGFVRVTAQDGDVIRAVFKAEPSVRHFPLNNDCVCVDLGPLTFSLKYDEEWIAAQVRTDKAGLEWTDWDVKAKDPVFPALDLSEKIKISKRRPVTEGSPFTPDNAPVELTARGYRVDGWGIGDDNTVMPVPPSPPAVKGAPLKLTLVPLGCMRARLSCFPHVNG